MLVLKDFVLKVWNPKSVARLKFVYTSFSMEAYELLPNGETGDLILYGFADGVVMCPYEGTAFSKVPGYVSGYGCPRCKGLSYHLPINGDYAEPSDGKDGPALNEPMPPTGLSDSDRRR